MLKSDDRGMDWGGPGGWGIPALRAPRLRLDGAGAIKAVLAGKVAAQYVDLSGAGSYQASELASDNVVLRVSGAGKAFVNASSSLKVDVSGAGAVQYLGNPTVVKELSGVATVTRRESP